MDHVPGGSGPNIHVENTWAFIFHLLQLPFGWVDSIFCCVVLRAVEGGGEEGDTIRNRVYLVYPCSVHCLGVKTCLARSVGDPQWW